MNHIEANESLVQQVAQALSAVPSETDRAEYNLAGLKAETTELIELLQCAMYPHIFCDTERCEQPSAITGCYLLQKAFVLLRGMLARLDAPRPNVCLDAFFYGLPDIKTTLETDIQAAYDGDPAARSKAEIVLAYPAFEAISIYRMAHALHTEGVPMLPRMMTEYAHRITAIDIHPGAHIGRYFFIDHGTGVVIGETTTIGDHVKIYQGVTLGAKSFPTDEAGNPVKGIKRHPDIGNRVVIYAGATILGGDTHIGDDCVIGGNVWLTHSVENGKTVIAAPDGTALRVI